MGVFFKRITATTATAVATAVFYATLTFSPFQDFAKSKDFARFKNIFTYNVAMAGAEGQLQVDAQAKKAFDYFSKGNVSGAISIFRANMKREEFVNSLVDLISNDNKLNKLMNDYFDKELIARMRRKNPDVLLRALNYARDQMNAQKALEGVAGSVRAEAHRDHASSVVKTKPPERVKDADINIESDYLARLFRTGRILDLVARLEPLSKSSKDNDKKIVTMAFQKIFNEFSNDPLFYAYVDSAIIKLLSTNKIKEAKAVNSFVQDDGTLKCKVDGKDTVVQSASVLGGFLKARFENDRELSKKFDEIFARLNLDSKTITMVTLVRAVVYYAYKNNSEIDTKSKISAEDQAAVYEISTEQQLVNAAGRLADERKKFYDNKLSSWVTDRVKEGYKVNLEDLITGLLERIGSDKKNLKDIDSKKLDDMLAAGELHGQIGFYAKEVADLFLRGEYVRALTILRLNKQAIGGSYTNSELSKNNLFEKERVKTLETILSELKRNSERSGQFLFLNDFKIVVDGIYSPEEKNAVAKFQEHLTAVMAASGKEGNEYLTLLLRFGIIQIYDIEQTKGQFNNSFGRALGLNLAAKKGSAFLDAQFAIDPVVGGTRAASPQQAKPQAKKEEPKQVSYPFDQVIKYVNSGDLPRAIVSSGLMQNPIGGSYTSSHKQDSAEMERVKILQTMYNTILSDEAFTLFLKSRTGNYKNIIFDDETLRKLDVDGDFNDRTKDAVRAVQDYLRSTMTLNTNYGNAFYKFNKFIYDNIAALKIEYGADLFRDIRARKNYKSIENDGTATVLTIAAYSIYINGKGENYKPPTVDSFSKAMQEVRGGAVPQAPGEKPGEKSKEQKPEGMFGWDK